MIKAGASIRGPGPPSKGLEGALLFPHRRGRNVAVEAEEVFWVVAILELHQALPVFRGVSRTHSLRTRSVKVKEVQVGGASLIRSHFLSSQGTGCPQGAPRANRAPRVGCACTA